MIGFLMFRVAVNTTLQRRCYQNAFPSVPFLETSCHIDCAFDQHGTNEEKACWTRLMKCKVRSLRDSPYDITVAVDTDVWPDATSDVSKFVPAVTYIANRHDFSATVDTWSDGDYVTSTAFNGGFVIIRRSPAILTFLNNVLAFLDKHPGSHEQFAYQQLLINSNNTAVPWGFLHHTWSCRNPAIKHCKFVHSHAVTGCPYCRKKRHWQESACLDQ